MEFLIDCENITDSNNILNKEIISETVHHTESSLNIIQPPIIVVVPQHEVANASTSFTFLDPEYSENIEIVNGGRKKKKINKRKIDQHNRNIIKPDLIINCAHKNKSKPFCKVSEIDVQCLNIFKQNLCSLESKIDQDKFLISMMTIQKPLRTDRRKINKTKINSIDRNTVKYYIPTKEGKIAVCASAFRSISSISRKRLNIISKNFQLDLCSPIEKRGGKRENPIDQQVTESIIEHITQFKAKKSHYSRTDTGRSYLPPGLTVNKMFSLWKNKMLMNNEPVSSFSKYYSIFSNNFNLGFGHPRQDVCSYCTESEIKIKSAIDEKTKIDLIENLSSHKERSKTFHKLLKQTNNKSMINISFDMMQNQPLPKLSVTDTFYCRQVWLYNLTFVLNSEKQNSDSCFMYTWLETQSGRGPNEVASAIIDFLEMIDTKFQSQNNPPTIINLFSDSCSAQNKNQYVMIALLHFVNFKAKIIKEINHYFPVRGHSYMPPDQVFGRIEKDLRQMENIISPEEYYNVFKKYTTIKIFDKDYSIMDYKEAAKKIVKKTEFKSTEQKCFSYICGKKTVGISQTYEGEPIRVPVLKKNGNLENIGLVEKLQITSHVKQQKKDDVKRLLKYFNIPPDAKDFYNDILNDAVIETSAEEDCQEYEEDNI